MPFGDSVGLCMGEIITDAEMFICSPARFEVRDGMFICIACVGGVTFRFVYSPATFFQTVRNAKEAEAKWHYAQIDAVAYLHP